MITITEIQIILFVLVVITQIAIIIILKKTKPLSMNDLYGSNGRTPKATLNPCLPPGVKPPLPSDQLQGITIREVKTVTPPQHLKCGHTKVLPRDSKKYVKPPLGLMSRRIWLEHRMAAINEAMGRYIEVGKPIPNDWINELSEINKEIK